MTEVAEGKEVSRIEHVRMLCTSEQPSLKRGRDESPVKGKVGEQEHKKSKKSSEEQEAKLTEPGVKLEEHEANSAMAPSQQDAQRQKRGHHVKVRPQMQEHAREGQKHWGQKVVELRLEWNQKQIWAKHPHFQEQIRMCNRQHIKSQHESLLRVLHIALVEGLIRLPEGMDFTWDEDCSFLGWTGFAIVPPHAAAFRRTVEGMFARPPQDKTLNNTLRRAGLMPERGWGEAWSGIGAFIFDKTIRHHYSGKKFGDDGTQDALSALELMTRTAFTSRAT